MPKLLLFVVCLLLIFPATAQVGIGTPTPNIHAVLDLKSPGNNQGLITPSLTTAQRTDPAFVNSLGVSENGLLVFDADDHNFYYWTGAQWDAMLHGQGANPVGTAGGDLAGNYPNPVIGQSKVTSGTIQDGTIADADISLTAAIQDAKLSTIATPGKVSGNAITSGTIGGSTNISTTGAITAAGGIITTSTSTVGTFVATNMAAIGGTAISGSTMSTTGGYGVYGQGAGAAIGKTTSYSLALYGRNTYNGSLGYIGGQYGVYGENAAGTAIQGVGKTAIAGNGGNTGGGIGLYGSASGTSSYGIYSSGTAGGSTTWNASSDFRFKKNIVTLDNAISKVMALRGVSFDWRFDEFPERNFATYRDIGFIAQEIRKVLPEVVMQDRDGYYSVSYEKVVPVLIEAIKQQQDEISDLKKTREELANFKIRLQAIEEMLAFGKPVSNTVAQTTHEK